MVKKVTTMVAKALEKKTSQKRKRGDDGGNSSSTMMAAVTVNVVDDYRLFLNDRSTMMAVTESGNSSYICPGLNPNAAVWTLRKAPQEEPHWPQSDSI